jgi:DNA polymerase-4
MDAFYAAVEVRDDPTLAGKPLIIGHNGGRGVVSTCSYEARKFGVRSAMPSVVAHRLCPNAIWRRGRMPVYVRESRRIRALLDNVSPLVEPLSIDEAFFDLTGIARDFNHAAGIAQRLRQRLRESLGLTGSVGIASNKFLAKIASDMDKPDGLTLLPHTELTRRFHPLPIERLWGVGPRSAEKLHDGGIMRVGDLLRIDERRLVQLVGERSAGRLRQLARGEDDRPVSSGRVSKSISEERTYSEDLRELDRIDRAMLARAEGVARQLRRKGLVARTVHLKVRRGDFTTWTRSETLRRPTDLAEPIVAAARQLFHERIDLGSAGVRLLGVGVSALTAAGAGQHELFMDDDERRARKIARASDAVRDRIGEAGVTRARLLSSPSRDGSGDDEADEEEASSLPSVD